MIAYFAILQLRTLSIGNIKSAIVLWEPHSDKNLTF